MVTRNEKGEAETVRYEAVFFFNDTATTEIYTAQYTLSLHDALPISLRGRSAPARRPHRRAPRPPRGGDGARRAGPHVKRDSPRAILGVLTGLNSLNYLDRYVGAATLPLMLASLSLSDAA